jgi:hypothetical protein
MAIKPFAPKCDKQLPGAHGSGVRGHATKPQGIQVSIGTSRLRFQPLTGL